MTYRYSTDPLEIYADNCYQWSVLLTIQAEHPIQEVFEFKERNLAENFITQANFVANASIVRFYDKNIDAEMLEVLKK